MKTKTKINGVIIESDDGDPETSDIVELEGELGKEADLWRINFLIRNLRHFGYNAVDKNGKIVKGEVKKI